MNKKILLTLIVALVPLLLNAQQIITENGKAYKLHKVEKGEGLYRIGINYNVTQEEIIQANPQLKNTGLVVGGTIKIPIKQAAVETPAVEAANYTTHIVEKGETAFSISQKYGMKLAEFYAMNPECEAGLPTGKAVKVKTTQENNAFKLHKISAGETLYNIGKKYGVKVEKIIECNPSLDIRSLPIGTLLRIPDTEIPIEDDKFYYHHVAAGETLYSLSVKYNEPQERIMEINPEINWQTLQVGQIVAIPKQTQPKVQYVEHTVERRETLYGISKKYGVTIESIAEANPEVDTQNLRKDIVLRIPIATETPDNTPATLNPLYIGTFAGFSQTQKYDYEKLGRPTINVALMLPFNANEEMTKLHWNQAQTTDNGERKAFTFKSRRYIEFYEGMKMAVDSLAQTGANIALHVYDTHNSTALQNILADPETAKMDIIVGPSHLKQMKEVATFAKNNRIPMVLPFTQMDSTILDNPFLFQTSVIDTVTGKAIADEMIAAAEGKHVILLNTNTTSKIDQWRTEYIARTCKEKGIEITPCNFDASQPETSLEILRTDKENVLIMPTNNEARINSVIVAFASIKEQKPEAVVTLFGMGDWLTFQTIEVDVYHKLNTVIFSTFGIDYTDPFAQQVMTKYKRTYFAEPVAFTPYFQKVRDDSGFSEYALWGFDIAMQFIGARIELGPQFVWNINSYKTRLVQTNFRFEHLTNWGGSVNVGLKTLTFGADNTIKINDINR